MPSPDTRACEERSGGTYLYVRCLREVHVVHSVHEVLRGDALTTEETAVQTLDGVLTALDTVELDVDLSVGRTGSDADVHDLAVAAVALLFDVLFELLVPTGLLSTKVLCQLEVFGLRVKKG